MSQVYLNGNGTGTGTGVEHADSSFADSFYEKLLRLNDEIVAGTHPRLKLLPAKTRGVGRVDASLPVQDVDFQQPLRGGDTHRTIDAQYAPATNGYVSTPSFVGNAPPVSLPPNPNGSVAVPQHRPTSLASPPKIDPSLLKKSATLIRAEEELKRRKQQTEHATHRRTESAMQPQHNFAIRRSQLEKTLSHQANSIRANEGDLVAIDVSVALARAEQLVPPTNLSPSPAAPSAESSPFNENSYYSNDEDLYEPPTQVAAPSGHANALPGLQEPASQQDWEPEWDDEEDDGEDYEPPAQDAFEDHSYHPSQMAPPQSARLAQYGSNHHHLPPAAAQAMQKRQGKHGGGPTIIENRIRSPISIVVNEIPHPAAPQPSRISPLALGNMVSAQPPQFNGHQRVASGPHGQHGQQGQQGQQNQQGGRRDEFAARKQARYEARMEKKAKQKGNQGPDPAKKRKHNGSPDTGNGRKNKKGKRRAASPTERTSTPEPYIKPEPITPPPGIAPRDSGPSRRSSRIMRDDPGEVMLSSPRIARPRSAYPADYAQSPRGYGYAGEDSDGIALQHSAPHRRPQRDTQDLRRVASLHSARRPVSPAAYAPLYETEVDRPRIRASAYPESIRPDGTRLVRVVRSPSPTYGSDPYTRAHSTAVMAPPPPRPVIVDEYGNRYEMVAPAIDYGRSVAPQPRRLEAEPYYERAVTREPTLRPVRVADPYEEEPYRMPPPPRTRAFTQLPEDATHPRERAFSVRPREVSSRDVSSRAYGRHEQVVERRPPPPRFDDPLPESVNRAYSVHPEPPPRRDTASVAYATRPDSVQAGAYSRRDMPPPPMPVSHPRESVHPDDGYHFSSNSSRGPVPQRRDHYPSQRGGGELQDEYSASPYGRRIINYGQ